MLNIYKKEEAKNSGLDISVPVPDTPVLSDLVAEGRAVKYDFALGDSSPGLARVKSLIQSPGGDEQLRESAKSDEERKRWEAAVSLYSETPDPEDLKAVVQASKRRIGTDSVIEKKFAERAMALSLGLTENPEEINDDAEAAPVLSQGMYDAYSKRLEQHEGFLKLQEDAEAEYKGSSWAGFSGDMGKSLIPLYSWSTQRNETLGESLSSWLPGSNKEEQYAYLRSMPPEDSIALARTIYKEMAAANLIEARQWVSDLVDYNTQGVDDVFGGLDLLSVTPVGLARKMGAKAAATGLAKISTRQALKDAGKRLGDFNRVRADRSPDGIKKALEGTVTALEGKRRKLLDELTLKVRGGNTKQAAVVKSVLDNITKDVNDIRSGLDELSKTTQKNSGAILERVRRTGIAASDKHLDLPKMLSATGHLKEAARLQAMELAKKTMPQAGKTVQREFADLIERTPSLFNPQSFMLDAATFSAVRAERISNVLIQNQDLFSRSISSVANASRIPIDIEHKALEAAEDAIRNQFPRVRDAVIHAVHRFESKTNPLTNTAYVEAVFGRSNGTLFKDAKSALNTGKRRYGLPITEKDIFQEGDGYAIRIRKDIDETTPDVRDSLITLDNQSNTKYNKIFGIIPVPKALSGAKDSVSKFQANQRAITTHATTALQMLNKKMMEVASTLSKREFEDLKVILNSNRDAGSGDNRGKFFQSVFELEEAYATRFSRLPTDKEAAAYQAFVQGSDADYLYRAGQELKEKSRRGVERITINDKGKDLTFDGQKVDYVPFDSKHIASVYYSPTQEGKGKYYRLSEIRADEQRIINKQIKEGAITAIQVYNPEDDVLRGGLKVSGPVNFIVTPVVSREALKFTEQLPYRAGFHVKYKDEYFVKQPRLFTDSTGRKVYGGDTVALGVSNTAKAAEEVALFERARLAVKAKDDFALASVINDGLPLTVKEVKQLFKERFDINTPFAVVKGGQSVADPSVVLGTGRSLQAEIGHFDDYSNSPFNLSKQLSQEFTGHKDGPLWSIKNTGTEEKPVWNMEEARTVDVIDSQMEAMGKLIRNKHYNDYQISAAESWVQEFGVKKGLIQIDGRPVTAEELRRNPGHYLLKGTIEGVSQEAATARNTQRAIRNLISHKSLLSNHISNFQAKLLASAYDRSGEKYIETIDNWSALLKSDLPSKMRAIAFHTKLGLGNPVQVLLQSQTLFNIGFISPKHGVPATLVSAFMRRLDLIPSDTEAIKSLAGMAAKLNPAWSADEFIESHRLLKRTGFDLVGGDLSWRNDISDPKLFTSAAGKFLDWSAGLFNGTERFVRLAAWNTSYKEYLERFPKLAGKLSDDDAKAILSRAQDLSGNMTRDSHAFWQEGAASTVTQFWGYSMRMFDLMTGMRLTTAEKGRLLAGWSAMYGVPVAGTALLPVWPYKDSVREMLLANDTNPDEGLTGLIMNGMLSVGVAAVTGDRYDIGARYGVGEIPILKTLTDTRYGETTWDDISRIAMGASGSITGDIINDMAPIVGDLSSIVTGDGDDSTMMQDVSDLFSNVSTYKQAERALAIYNTGMHMSKDGRVIQSGRDPFEGFGHFLTGLETLDATNSRAMDKVVRAQQSLATQARRDAKEYIRLYFRSLNDGDRDSAQKFIKKARRVMIGGGLDEKQMQDNIQSTIKEKDILDMSTDRYIKSGKTPEERIRKQEAVQ